MDGLIQIYASRDIAIGLATLAMWYHGSNNALAYSMFAGCVITGTDGWVSKKLIGKGEWMHWGFMLPGFAIGAGLLGWI